MNLLAFHSIATLKPPQRRLPRVGKCIYCNCSPSDAPLEDEHFFPDGLGGDLILQDASCRGCAQTINQFENRVLNEHFGYVRKVLGQRSRKRRGPARGETAIVLGDGSEDLEAVLNREIELAKVSVRADMPYSIMLEVFSEQPGIITGQVGRPIEHRLAWFNPPDIDSRARTMNDAGDFIMVATIEYGDFTRFLAKIAHGYATSCIGFGNFKPLLTGFIRGEPLHWPDYIGSARVQLGNPTDSIHILAAKEEPFADGQRALVVLIQFFGNHVTPIYKVVVGLLPQRQEDSVGIS